MEERLKSPFVKPRHNMREYKETDIIDNNAMSALGIKFFCCKEITVLFFFRSVGYFPEILWKVILNKY